MKIETFKIIKKILADGAVDDISITFSNGDSIIVRKDDKGTVVNLNEGYIDVYNGRNNKYYSIDQIVSIEKYEPKTAKVGFVNL